MSQRQAKRRRKALQAEGVESYHSTNGPINMENIYQDLRNIMKRFPGWHFISISKPGAMKELFEDPQLAPIQMHKRMPAMNDLGLYDAGPGHNHVVEWVRASSPEFQGLLMDRTGKACLGDPFAVDIQDPEIQKELDRVFAPKQTVVDLSDANVETL